MEKYDWDEIEEKVLSLCHKAFWPVFILWVIAALAKIIITILGIT